MNASVEFKNCPACNSFEFVEGESCLVCGFNGSTPPPHYSLRYAFPGIPADALPNIEDAHGEMPLDDLVATEAWLKTREEEGYEFHSCVVVSEQAHVAWLRGSPADWNWSEP